MTPQAGLVIMGSSEGVQHWKQARLCVDLYLSNTGNS